MGRKKIQIKLIKNQRLKNITYNKRKRGLLKKIVELTKLCGIQATLQIKDIFGNLIILDSGIKEIEKLKQELPPERQYTFTSQDYPDFKGFQNIRKHREIETGHILSESDKHEAEQILKIEQNQHVDLKLQEQNHLPRSHISLAGSTSQFTQQQKGQNTQVHTSNYVRLIQETHLQKQQILELFNMISSYMRNAV